MKNGSPVALMLLILAAAGALAACASPPSRFYTLTPLASAEAKKPGAAASRLAIKVEPVEIPDYLDRPQIVTREGQNGVKVAEFDRWAGSLGKNISDVVAEDLALLLGTDRVLVDDGAPLGKADYTVAVRVVRLDCVPGDRVLLKAQWRLLSADGKRGGAHLSSITEKVADGQYATLVAAVNRAVEELSREMAAGIASYDRGTVPPSPSAGAGEPAPKTKQEGESPQ